MQISRTFLAQPARDRNVASSTAIHNDEIERNRRIVDEQWSTFDDIVSSISNGSR